MVREEDRREIKKEEKVLDEIVDKPMGDDDIKEYLPHCPVILYNELKNYHSINQILPKVKSYAIILYLDGPHSGHWTAIMKPNDKEIEYFDSYGHPPDEPLNWTSGEKKHELGIDAPYLTDLLKASRKKIIWNKMKFQGSGDPDISTCGRHCCFRIQMMKNRNMNIHQYGKMMERVKKQVKKPYDELVSIMVSPEAD